MTDFTRDGLTDVKSYEIQGIQIPEKNKTLSFIQEVTGGRERRLTGKTWRLFITITAPFLAFAA